MWTLSFCRRKRNFNRHLAVHTRQSEGSKHIPNDLVLNAIWYEHSASGDCYQRGNDVGAAHKLGLKCVHFKLHVDYLFDVPFVRTALLCNYL